MINIDRLHDPDLTDIPTAELIDVTQELDHLPAAQREYVRALITAELDRRRAAHGVDTHS